MIHEFWDIRTNNLIDAFGSRHEALEALGSAVEKQGEWIVEFLMLMEDDSSEPAKTIVGIGSELLSFIQDPESALS